MNQEELTTRMMATVTDTPRIYLASLSDYNAGRLHGVWVDAVDIDDIHEALGGMLRASKEPWAEEWAIHDYEGFGGYRVSEYENLDTLAEIGAAIEEHGPAVGAYLDNMGTGEFDLGDFEESYAGEWGSEEEYTEEWYSDLIDRDNYLANYIDWERVAHELFMGDHWSAPAPGGNVYVFISI